MTFRIYPLLFLIITSSVILGGYLLENLGVSYVSQGGSPFFKIHFYSYLTLVGFSVVFLRNGITGFSLRLGDFYRLWVISLFCVVFVIVYGYMRHGSSGMAYLVNTFLVPILIVPLLTGLTDRQKYSLLKVIAYLILLNSLLAVVEYMLHFRLVSVEFSEFSFFRSTAFLTHPLNNALTTVSVALVLASRTKLPSFVYIVIVILALFAFGGRAALAVFFMIVVASVFFVLWRAATRGVRVNKQKVAIFMFIGYFVLLLASYILLESGITERIVSKLYIDGSATARFNVYYLLEQLNANEWFLGASDRLLESIEFYIGINVIENYFIGWIFTFGLLGAIPLFLAVFVPLIYFFANGDFIDKLSVFSFILVGFSNNSLTTKTPVLLLLFTCLYLSLSVKKNLLLTNQYKKIWD